MNNSLKTFSYWLGAALLLALSFGVPGGQVWAQACSPNMDFSDPASTRYLSGGSGSIAFRGFVTGNLLGRVRNGKLTSLDLNLDPDINGPNGLRRMSVDYNASPSLAAPSFRCTPLANGVRINITRVVVARQYFQSDGTYSNGYADLEITFERNGPGRLIARYQHSAFNRADTTPPRPFNGTVANAIPQAGKRLTITTK